MTVKSWAKKTPQNFKFTAKFPRVITHEKRLKYVHKELDQFFEAIGPLAEKTLALLIQLPPSMQIVEGLERLRELVLELDTRFRYAVEVKDRSWFQDLAFNFFANNGICLVWSQLAEIKTLPIATTDFLYLRLIGDRSIQEKDFGKIQIDRPREMRKWAKNITNVGRERDQVNLAIITAHNHYAGFGPGTVNMFRTMLDVPEAKWEEKEEEHETHTTPNLRQRTLTDFLS